MFSIILKSSSDTNLDSQSPELGSPVESRQRRQPIPRRPSSKNLPRRGQGFSVDDASQEIEREKQQEQTRRGPASTTKGSSTIRRRQTAQPPRLPFISSNDAEEDEAPTPQPRSATIEPQPGTLSRQNTYESRSGSAGDAAEDGQDASDENQEDDEGEGNDDDDLSDAESFTLKDRQEAINETHPFGIRIWKPALYKKGRSVEKEAEGDIHSAPGGRVSNWLLLFNCLWTLVFGWWLALVAGAGALLCLLLGFAPGCQDYGYVLWGLAGYIFYPFGKYVKLIQEEAYAHEDEGEGRSISEYERWQQGDLEEGRLFFGPVRGLVGRRRSDDDSDDNETTSLLGRDSRDTLNHEPNNNATKRRLFGRGQWNLGRVIYFIFFYGLLTPLLFFVSMLCWLMVFALPMGRVTLILIRHLQRRPLSLEFHADSTYTRGVGSTPSAIILCTYRATGLKYWKYTVDGTNIFLINLLGVVAFIIFDYWVFYQALGLKIALTNTIFMFLLSLFSIIPLAYFIGQAVASISAQSTMGVGAAINAFFSTVVEVFLYCVALKEGKAKLVEGSIIGSIFAGILFLPGISMCFGAIKRKTQRFNVRSAGVTSTMLLFAVIGAFSPTLFYQIYGAQEMSCHQCTDESGNPLDRDCRRCFFAQVPAVQDSFYQNAVRPYGWFAAILLFLSYIIGLLFTLRTHASTIWNTELDEKRVGKLDSTTQRIQNPAIPSTYQKPVGVDYGTASSTPAQTKNTANPPLPRSEIRDSQLYRRILNQSLKQAESDSGVGQHYQVDGENAENIRPIDGTTDQSKMSTDKLGDKPKSRQFSLSVQGLSEADTNRLAQYMAEMAATAAAVATRDATQNPRKASTLSKVHTSAPVPPTAQTSGYPMAQPSATDMQGSMTLQEAPAAGGHDAPNWGRVKSYTILLTATLAYAVIAEILVNTVDAVLTNIDIDEKFLGITLFALVPNTTEFLNAISFAMNGNIALSMEIGSAYALQVCLLQVPALVLFSSIHGMSVDPAEAMNHAFTLLFPQWDMVTVILCVFLLSYMYGEGKSNYFKGSILILSYLVVIVGFYLAGHEVDDPSAEKFVAAYHSGAGLGRVGQRSRIEL